MGNQEGKPQQKSKENLQNQANDLNQNNAKPKPDQKPQKIVPNKSNQNSPRINQNSPRINQNSQQNSKVNQRRRRSQKSSLDKNVQQPIGEDEDDNQFMPLMRLGQKGQIKLIVAITQLLVSQNNLKPSLLRNSSNYDAVLKYTRKDNIYSFILKEQDSSGAFIKVDLQGNIIEENVREKQRLWLLLCPINVPFGSSHRTGHYICINMYERLDDEEQDNDDVQTKGPSLKNIEFELEDEMFYKWNQEPYRKQNIQSNKTRKKNEALLQYKQISRYFDQRQRWLGSTFVEQTQSSFKAWVVCGVQGGSAIDSQLQTKIKKNLKIQQQQYIRIMYKKLN